ncbi:DUF6069 family protein [Micromonospora sp. WMMD1102]|uniref:DUF6069 family protein n=1 Tax=Micromonospora sp. WMMD1102 TaxID=3016105 RepID=UPI0024157A55|nr:DUF6069 family protein [Micromonospora sp. WMMD1102]MDG4784762.1 DUF6069 family protein [Micromonospora sp. WMMD1102]
MSVTENRPVLTGRGLNWWQAIGGGVVAAAVGNLLVFAVGKIAGVSFVYRDATGEHEVNAVGVLVASVPPLVVGTGLAVLISLWWRPILRVAQVVGGGLALLTVLGPLNAGADTGTRVAPAAMHVVLGIVVVLTLEAVRRSSAPASGR